MAEDYKKYALIIMLLIFIYISYKIIEPFITTILSAAILAYIFYPLHKKLNSYIKKDSISALLITLLIIILILVPLIFIAELIIKESIQIYRGGQVQALISSVYELAKNTGLTSFLNTTIEKVSAYTSSLVSESVVNLPYQILNLLIMVFLIFFMIKDGEKLLKNIEYIPLKELHKKDIVEQINSITKSTIYGWFVAGLFQGLAGTIGLIIFGVPNPFFWGFLLTISAMLPFGAALVWLPASIWLILSNNIISGIGLLIYGLIVVSLIDNVVKIKILKDKSKIHPIVSLLGIFGGIAIFGLVGLVIGPLILSLSATLLKMYGEQ